MFTISSSIGKDNYKQLKLDAKKGCKNCPFKFCVADNCKAYKKLILSNKDEIMYIVKNKYSEGNMNYKIDGNKGKQIHKVSSLFIGMVLGSIITLSILILFFKII